MKAGLLGPHPWQGLDYNLCPSGAGNTAQLFLSLPDLQTLPEQKWTRTLGSDSGFFSSKALPSSKQFEEFRKNVLTFCTVWGGWGGVASRKRVSLKHLEAEVFFWGGGEGCGYYSKVRAFSELK